MPFSSGCRVNYAVSIRMPFFAALFAAFLVLVPSTAAFAAHDWLDFASFGRWRSLRPSSAPGSGSDRRFELGDLNRDGRLDYVTNAAGGIQSALGNADGTFGDLQFFGDGTTPKGSFALGDLNHDGVPDAVVADIGALETTVSVFLANGSGGFGPRTGYVAGAGRRWLALGDVNRDGKLDLAMANQPTGGPYSVAVALGNGAGGFGAATSFAEASPPSEIALADLNRDGKQDLYWIRSTPNQVAYRLGNGDGTFGASLALASGGTIVDVQTSDLNRDGRLDFVWTRSGASLDTASIALALPAGGFGGPTNLAFSGDSDVPAIGDFNEDGKLDLVALYKDSRGFYAGNGDGTFAAPVLRAGLPINFALSNVHVVDLDQDGHLDIAYSVPAADFGNGNGTFGDAATLTTAAGPAAVALAAVNADALPDLVVACRGANVASVFLNSGGGAWGARQDYALGAGAVSLCLADFNGDGRKDLATANQTGNSVSVLLNNGSGGFLAKTDLAVGTAPVAIQTGDLNADGKADLVVANQGSSNVSVLIGSGTGTFARTDYTTSNLSPCDVILADWNGDGKPDLAMAAAGVVGGGILIRLNNGNGTFGAETSFEASLPKRSLAAADFDKDGKQDLAASDVGFQVTYFRGNGNGTFGAGTIYFMNSNAFAVQSADLDGDTNPDLALGHSFGYFWGLDGTGAGTFVDGNYGFAGRGAAGTMFASHQLFALGDIQNDGRLDVATVGETSNTVALLQNRGSAAHPIAQNGWAAPQAFTSPAGPRGLAIADFNRDGKLDASAAASGPNQVAVSLGNGTGTFAAGSGFAASASIRELATSDLNRDGIEDVVSVGATGVVSVLLGTGTGSLGPKADSVSGGSAHDVEVGDLNGDGIVDVVLDETVSGVVKAYPGTGTGALGMPVTSSIPGGGGCPNVDLDLADVNLDGRLDAVAAAGTCGVKVLLGNGALGFTGSTITMGTQPGCTVIADLNRDGKPDIAVADLVGASVVVRLNSAASPGTFLGASSYSGIDMPSDILAADVDQDGDLDLLVGSSQVNAYAVLKNNGSGTFGGRVVYGMNGPVMGLGVADVNRDGMLDVLSSNGNGNVIAVRLGQRATVTSVETPPAPAGFALAQNRPNPFNPVTKIQFAVGRAERVQLRVFDAQGRLVATLLEGMVPAGRHEVSWAGRNDGGRPVASGVYFYQLEAGAFSQSRRMVLLK